MEPAAELTRCPSSPVAPYTVQFVRPLCMTAHNLRRSHKGRHGLRSPLHRAINQLCVTVGGARSAASHPPGNLCFRGGGFDDRYRTFFAPGRKFRQPTYAVRPHSHPCANVASFPVYPTAYIYVIMYTVC